MVNNTRRTASAPQTARTLVEFFAAVLVALLMICFSTPILAKADSLPTLHHNGSLQPSHKAAADVHLAAVNRITFHHRSFLVQHCDGNTYLAKVQRVSGDSRRSTKAYFSRVLSGVLTAKSDPKRVVGEFSATATYSKDARLAVYGQFDVGQTSCTLLQTASHQRIFEKNVPEQLPACGNEPDQDISADVQQASAPDSGQASLDGSNVVVDVMVMYSPEARAAAGGTAAMQAEVNAAVAQANQAYANSQISQQLRLVYTGETSTSENAAGANGDFSTNLSRLQNSSDGYYDEVAGLRDQYGADVVSVLIQSDGSYCGLGFLMTSNSSGFAPYAFNVVARGCISNKSFQHEIGHNMGANHDQANSGGAGAYSYSYGWRFTGGSGQTWRSVMAYAPGTRINYFSSPDVSYDGAPTGTVNANNALTLNNTASTISAFRSSVSNTPIGTPPSPETPGGTPTPVPTTAPALSKVSLSKYSANSSQVVLVAKALDSSKKPIKGEIIVLQKYSKSALDYVSIKTGKTNSTGTVKFKVKFQSGAQYRAIAEVYASSAIKFSKSWLRSASRRR